MSGSTSRSVSRELNPEAARRLRALEQSQEALTSRLGSAEAKIAQMTTMLQKSNKLKVTGTQAFLLRNQ